MRLWGKHLQFKSLRLVVLFLWKLLRLGLNLSLLNNVMAAIDAIKAIDAIIAINIIAGVVRISTMTAITRIISWHQPHLVHSSLIDHLSASILTSFQTFFNSLIKSTKKHMLFSFANRRVLDQLEFKQVWEVGSAVEFTVKSDEFVICSVWLWLLFWYGGLGALSFFFFEVFCILEVGQAFVRFLIDLSEVISLISLVRTNFWGRGGIQVDNPLLLVVLKLLGLLALQELCDAFQITQHVEYISNLQFISKSVNHFIISFLALLTR